MRKQFKKGVAILSAVSMVAAGISYVPQNVKADAPAIAVQDSEEGVDYSSLTYTQVGKKDYYVAANNDDFLCAEDIAGIEDEILKIRKLAELECYVESEAYLTEDEKKFDDVQSALKYATLYLKFDKYYIIKKTNGAGETECKFWYNKNLDLVGYDLMVNSF